MRCNRLNSRLTALFSMVALAAVWLAISGSHKTVARLDGAADVAAQAQQRLGLAVQPLTPQLAHRLGLEDEQGVVVTGIEPGSAAADTLLRQGDLIKEFDRQSVTSVDDLALAVSRMDEGDAAALLVRRGPAMFLIAIELPA